MYPRKHAVNTLLTLLCIFANYLCIAQAPDSSKKTDSTNYDVDVLQKAAYDPISKSAVIDFRVAQKTEVNFVISKMNSADLVFTTTYQAEKNGNQNIKIDMSGLPNGAYVIGFRSRNRFSGRRLVIKN